MKYQIILISHNKLACGVKAALEMISGSQNILSYGLMPGENPDALIIQISKILNKETNYLILADLFGGSMANSAVSLLVKKNVKMIAGLNLALALQVLIEKPWTEVELAKVIDNAQKGIQEVKINNSIDEINFF